MTTDKRRTFVDLSPIRLPPAFARLWFNALIPASIAAPLAGMIADAFDRRKLLLIVAVILLLSTTGLLALAVIESNLSAVGQHVWVWPFYVFTTVGAIAGIAIGATRSAIVPHIVSRELVAPAHALNGLSIGAQFMAGPSPWD